MAYFNLPKKKDRRIQTNQTKGYQKIYQDPRWKSLRDWKFRHFPICEECERNGITSITEEIHHVIRFADGANEKEIKILAFARINTMALCIKCHKLKHEKYKTDYELRKKLLKY